MIALELTPILNVSDLNQRYEWFVRLGVEKRWSWPQGSDVPNFGAVRSGSFEMFLCKNGQGGRGKGPNTSTSGGPDGDDTMDKGCWLNIWVEDIDAVNAECVKHRLDITHPPTNELWGVREFHVRHPDGHVFCISQGLGGQSPPV